MRFDKTYTSISRKIIRAGIAVNSQETRIIPLTDVWQLRVTKTRNWSGSVFVLLVPEESRTERSAGRTKLTHFLGLRMQRAIKRGDRLQITRHFREKLYGITLLVTMLLLFENQNRSHNR